LYKIISITDKQGNDKSHYATSEHPQLLGDFYCLSTFRCDVLSGYEPYCCFIWEDNPNKMMMTSRVESISEWDNKIKIVTKNSIYVFEEVN